MLDAGEDEVYNLPVDCIPNDGSAVVTLDGSGSLDPDKEGDEELIYTALDYEHPPILNLDPPLVISSGQNIIAKATYYNNTDDWVNFGLFSTDEMMIIFGLVYFE